MTLIVLLGILLLAIVILLGPRIPVDTRIRPVELPEDLDTWLAEAESAHGDIVPGTEKTILWQHEDKRRTPYSIVYLHGFSASRQETFPLCPNLAQAVPAMSLSPLPAESLAQG